MTRSRRHILLLIFSGWHYDLSNWLCPYITSMLSSFYFLSFFCLYWVPLTYFLHAVVIPGFDCILSTFTSACGQAMSDCNSITKNTSQCQTTRRPVFSLFKIRKYTCITRLKTLFHILTNKIKSNLFPFKHKMLGWDALNNYFYLVHLFRVDTLLFFRYPCFTVATGTKL